MEWGLPDWRDPGAYPSPSDWSLLRWRWEFYRRRDDLRNAFIEAYERSLHSVWQESVQVLGPGEAGYAITIDEKTVRQFGYPMLPNPRIGEQPDWNLQLAGTKLEEMMVVAGGKDGHPIGEYFDLNFKAGSERAVSDAFHDLSISAQKSSRILHSAPKDKPREHLQKMVLEHFAACFPVFVEGQEVALIFDLSAPLELQLSRAKSILDQMQLQLHKRKLQKRRIEDRWPTYLRVLDAREAGASWAVISEQALPRRIDESGERATSKPQAARALWKQAATLQSNFPF